MRIFRTLGYFIYEGLMALWRHKALHGFAIFVVALSLYILGFSAYLTGNVNALLSSWQNKLEVRVFLDDGLPPDRVGQLQELFEKNPMVDSVRVVTPEEALQTLAKLAPAFGSAARDMQSNPLPTSLSVRLKPPIDLKAVHRLVARVSGEKGVDQVLFDWDWVDKLRIYTRFVSLVGWLLFAALGAAAVFTVAAITRILALSRREEIAILHFVGSTPAGIRGPFLAGGAIMGFLSGLLALIGLFATHVAMQRLSAGDTLLLTWLSHAFLPPAEQAALVGLGVVLGAVGGVASLGSVDRWT
jgi:cell division transport system permease protein